MENQQIQKPDQQSTPMPRRRGYDPFSLAMSPMDLLAMNPFSLMGKMLQEMSRATSTGSDLFWAPTTEIVERDGNYIVRADLPGLTANDVKVKVVDEALVIEGERKQEQQQDEGGVRRTERRYGRFYRVIELPKEAQVDQASAKFENGVLEVTVPVPAERRASKQIPVQTSSTSQTAPGATSASDTSGKQAA